MQESRHANESRDIGPVAFAPLMRLKTEASRAYAALGEADVPATPSVGLATVLRPFRTNPNRKRISLQVM